MAKISAYDQRSEPLAGAVGIIAQPGVKNFKVVNDLIGGWIGVDEAWTYNAANAINVPTGATSRFQKGWGVRFKQSGGTYKYGTIAVVASTLLTLIANTDYVVANEAIADIAVAPNPASAFGWPQYFNCAVTLSQGASNDISKTIAFAKFQTIGNLVKFKCRLTANAAGTAGSRINVSAPVTGEYNNFDTVGVGWYYDDAINTYYSNVQFDGSGAKFLLTSVASTAVTNAIGTAPAITVASGDMVAIDVSYLF